MNVSISAGHSHPKVFAAVIEASRDSGLILSKSGPHQSCQRMVPPICLSLVGVDNVAEGMDHPFAKAAGQ